MTTHLPFFDDALDEFLFAFSLYKDLDRNPSMRTAVRCVRSLSLAIEKICKHAIAEIDPYLLVTKPERRLLIELRKDLISQNAPTIFCSRVPFETLNALESWSVICELLKLDLEVSSAFERGYKPLIQRRNRAMHSEIYAAPEELTAEISEVLAKFNQTMSAVNPRFLTELSKRDGQLSARLRAIEAKVDGAWQVLLEYLDNRGPLDLVLQLYCTISESSNVIDVLLGGPSGAPNTILTQAHVHLAEAQGLFASILTQPQEESRTIARDAIEAELRGLDRTRRPSLRPQTQLLVPDPTRDGKLVPLESGRLVLETVAAWVSLTLPQISPSHLYLHARVGRLEIVFAESTSIDGSVEGRLEPLSPSASARSIRLFGSASLVGEYYLDQADELGTTKPPRTHRSFQLRIQLASTS